MGRSTGRAGKDRAEQEHARGGKKERPNKKSQLLHPSFSSAFCKDDALVLSRLAVQVAYAHARVATSTIFYQIENMSTITHYARHKATPLCSPCA